MFYLSPFKTLKMQWGDHKSQDMHHVQRGSWVWLIKVDGTRMVYMNAFLNRQTGQETVDRLNAGKHAWDEIAHVLRERLDIVILGTKQEALDSIKLNGRKPSDIKTATKR